MDPPSLVKTFKYNPSSQQSSMFSVSETQAHYRSSYPHNNSGFEDLSFSSYVKAKDPSQKSLENETNCNGDDTEISIFDAQRYFSESSDPKDMKRQEGQMVVPHDVVSGPRLSSVSSADGYGRNFRTRSFHSTPTASSEASWNSQTGLLANPPGSIGVSMRNFPSDDTKRRSSSVARKWIFGRKCCCTGKKSVQVKEIASDSDRGGHTMITTENNNNDVKFYTKRDAHRGVITPSNLSRQSNSITSDILEIHQHKVHSPNPPENNFQSTDLPRQQRVSASGMPFGDGPGGFSFPILNPSSQSTNRGVIAKPVVNPLEDPPRDSLEVFQPIHSRPPSLDNPVNGRGNFNPGSPIAQDDDMCSDASSDLFEIESFSTQTTPYPTYRRRDALDEASTFNPRRFAAANGLTLNTGNNNSSSSNNFGRRSLDEPPTPSVAATECYAPSEVSIDWSVTTAEGFDKASVSNFSLSASEFGSAALFRRRNQEESAGDGGKKKNNNSGGSGSGSGIGSGGLLLMSCRHEKAVSVGPQPVKCTAADGPPIFPLQVGSSRPPRANKPPMSSSHAARLSLAFAA